MFGVAVVAIRDMAFAPGRPGLSLPKHERLNIVVPAQAQTVSASASGTPNLEKKTEAPNVSRSGAGQDVDTAEDESETDEQPVEANLDAIECANFNYLKTI